MDMNALASAFEQNNAATTAAIAEIRTQLGAVDDLQASLDQIEARMNRPGSGVRMAGDADKAEARAAFAGYLRSGDVSGFNAGMSEVSDPDGGFTVPQVLADSITDQLVQFSPLRRLARVEKVSSPDFSIPVNKRGANSGWSVETGDRDQTNSPQIGLVTPGGAELYANVPVTNWLLSDSKYDIAGFVTQNVLDEFSEQETVFVSGDGAGGKPMGFLQQPRSAAADSARPFGTLQTVYSGAAAAITPDALIDMVHTLRSPYRQGDSVAWLMASSTISKVRRLKSGDGSYLWSDSLTAGQPATLLGFPVEECEAMPAVGAGTIPIAFGNWQRGYVITDIHGMTTIRDPFTKKGWTNFYFAKRVGGCTLDSMAIKLMLVGTGE